MHSEPFHWEPLAPVPVPDRSEAWPFTGPPAPLPPWANLGNCAQLLDPDPPVPATGAPLPDVTPRRAVRLNGNIRAPLSLDGPDPEWDATINDAEVCELAKANILTSEAQGRPGIHKFMIDVDLPVVVMPSSTPGHWHLYIDVDIEWERYVALLRALAEAGVIEVGYARASIKRGYTSLRPPWIAKREDERGGSSA